MFKILDFLIVNVFIDHINLNYPKSLYPSSHTNVALAPSRMSLALTGTGGWPQLFSETKV